MIRFKVPPDAVFLAILRKSIDYAIDVISDLLQVFNHDDGGTRREFLSLFPEIGRTFPPSVAKTALLNLRTCLESPEVYKGTDYHYLLLYDVLSFYADIHNELVIKARDRVERKGSSAIGPFFIEKIHLDEMQDLYFFNHNFLLDTETLLSLPDPVRHAMRPELFGLCEGLLPHPEELELKIVPEIERCQYEVRSSDFFGPKSKEYPDFKFHDSIERVHGGMGRGKIR